MKTATLYESRAASLPYGRLLGFLLGLLILASTMTFAQTVRWTFTTGAQVWSSAKVAGGTVYIGSDDGCLYALDAATGTQKWKFTTKGLIRCTPEFDGGVVYVASDDGNVYAVEAQTGLELWHSNIGNKILRHLPSPFDTGGLDFCWDDMQSSPVLVRGVLYVGSGDSAVYALKPGTGEILWKTKTGGLVRSTPFITDSALYVGSWDGGIYKVSLDSGKVVWRFETKGLQYRNVQPSPKVADGIVYCGSRNPVFYAIDAQTGKELWRAGYSYSWVESSAEIVDGVVYVGSSFLDKVFAFDAKTGREKWEYVTFGAPWSTPRVAGKTLYVGAVQARGVTDPPYGHLYALDTATGTLRWSVPTQATTFLGGVASSPAVDNETVYYGSLDGKVYAVSVLTTAVKEKALRGTVPDDLRLDCYPNPFNNSTTLRINISTGGEVTLRVHDLLGRTVADLIRENLAPGIHVVHFDAGALASGTYYCVLNAPGKSVTSKLVYVR